MKERAFALVVVTGIIAFLSALIAFNSIDIALSKTWAESLKMKEKAYFMALAGVEAVKAIIKNDTEEDRDQGKRIDFVPKEIDLNDEIWAYAGEYPVPIKTSDGTSGTVSGVIVDESSKINLNCWLVGGDGLVPRNQVRIKAVKRLFEILGLDPKLVDNIIDWIDKDDEGLAETSYYSLMDDPYEAKNAPLDAVSELLLVKGITDEVFTTLTSAGSELYRKDPLNSPFITVFPRVDDGSGCPVNINTAPREVLMALHYGIDEDVADEIIARRADEPFERVSEFIDYINTDLGVNLSKAEQKDLMEGMISVNTNYFSALVTAITGKYSTTIRTVLKRDSKTGTKILYWRVE